MAGTTAGMKLIRIAVIGAGHWGPNLIRNFHNHTTSEASGTPTISGGHRGAGAVRVLDALSRSLRNDGRREAV